MSQLYDSFVSYLSKSKGTISAVEHLKGISELSATAGKILVAEDGDADRATVAAARIRAMDFPRALPVLMELLTDPIRDPATLRRVLGGWKPSWSAGWFAG
jgi:hypothetical protein